MKIIDQCENRNENIIRITELVLKRVGITDKDVIIVKLDELSRIHLDIEGTRYTIRIWNYRELPKTRKAEVLWSLFMEKDAEEPNELLCGFSKFRYRYI